MKRTLLLLTVLVWASGSSFAFKRESLDRYLDMLARHDKFMGSIALSQNGRVIYTRSAGYADLESGIPATAASKYRIGSISKTFTAVIALKSAEEGRLRTGQTIDTWFPEIPNAGKITVAQLLNHRSGIYSITDAPDYLSWHTGPKSEKELTALISSGGSVFEPGTKAAYSNSNYILLTYILEKVQQKSYASLLKQYITIPLDLKNTYVFGPTDPLRQEARSYKYAGSWQREAETDASIPLGAGNIVSTPTDLVLFSNALFGGKILKPESLRLMQTIQDNYGSGLFEIPFSDKTGYGHTGGIDGFASVSAYFPEGGISFAITTNGSSIPVNDLAIAVLSAAYDMEVAIPDYRIYTADPETLGQYTGSYRSAQIPVALTVTLKDNTLFAQATGQPEFPLTPGPEDTFRFDPAGVVITFNTAAGSLELQQSGSRFTFTRE